MTTLMNTYKKRNVSRKPKTPMPNKALPTLPQSSSNYMETNMFDALTCDLNTNFHAQNTLNNQQKKEPNYIVIFTSGHSDVTKATQTWTQTETQSISTNFIPHKLEEKPKSNRSKQTYMSPMRPVSPTTTVSNASSFLHMHSKSPSINSSNMSYMSNNSCDLLDMKNRSNDSIKHDDDTLTIGTDIDKIMNWDPKHLAESSVSKSLIECDFVVKCPCIL